MWTWSWGIASPLLICIPFLSLALHGHQGDLPLFVSAFRMTPCARNSAGVCDLKQPAFCSFLICDVQLEVLESDDDWVFFQLCHLEALLPPSFCQLILSSKDGTQDTVSNNRPTQRGPATFVFQERRIVAAVGLLLTFFVLWRKQTREASDVIDTNNRAWGGHTLVEGTHRAVPTGAEDA